MSDFNSDAEIDSARSALEAQYDENMKKTFEIQKQFLSNGVPVSTPLLVLTVEDLSDVLLNMMFEGKIELHEISPEMIDLIREEMELNLAWRETMRMAVREWLYEVRRE